MVGRRRRASSRTRVWPRGTPRFGPRGAHTCLATPRVRSPRSPLRTRLLDLERGRRDILADWVYHELRQDWGDQDKRGVHSIDEALNSAALHRLWQDSASWRRRRRHCASRIGYRPTGTVAAIVGGRNGPSPMSAFGQPCIDADLHAVVPSVEALFPYLSDHWREYIRTSAFKGAVDTAYPPRRADDGRARRRGAEQL